MHRYVHPSGISFTWRSQPHSSVECRTATGAFIRCDRSWTDNYWSYQLHQETTRLTNGYLEAARETPTEATPLLCNFRGEYEPADRVDAIDGSDPLPPCQGVENKDLVYEVLSMALDQAMQLAPSDQVEVIRRLTGVRVEREYALATLIALEADNYAPLCYQPGLADYALQLYPDALERFVSEVCYALDLPLDVLDVVEVLRGRLHEAGVEEAEMLAVSIATGLVQVFDEHNEAEGEPAMDDERVWLVNVLARRYYV